MKRHFCKVLTFLKVFIVFGFTLSLIPLLYSPANAATPDLFTVMIPMRDGVNLAADVYLPDPDAHGLGPYPAILVMTPYNKTGMAGLTAYFQAIGYAVVIQDTRGRFASEGDYRPYETAGNDGYDTVEWIAAQSWCNENVGTFGPSAMGIAQLLTAETQPPHLKAMSVDVASPDMHDQSDYQGGAFRLSLVQGWLFGQSYNVIDRLTHGEGNVTNVLDVFIANEDKWFEHLPLKNFPILNRLQPSWNDIIYNPDDGPFWDATRTDLSKINVPVLQFGGWYDIFSQGTIDVFEALQSRGIPTKMVMGAWTHFNYFSNIQGDPDKPFDNAAFPGGFGIYLYLQGLWFDKYLKDAGPSLIDAMPPVTYYTIEAGPTVPSTFLGPYWRAASTWPPTGTTETSFYFTEGNGPDPLIDDGLLVTSLPDDNEAIDYIYDPRDPVPTVGGNNLSIPSGAFDQSSVEMRGDVITFSTEPLVADLEVSGRVIVKLFASSSATDTDFTAKLVDVNPADNYARNVVDGIIRGRYKDTDESQTLLVPGDINEFTIDLWSTSYLFKAGQRIRVEISSSNFPRFDRNPNTGDTFGKNGKLDVAQNTIYFGKDYPSRIVLPVAP